MSPPGFPTAGSGGWGFPVAAATAGAGLSLGTFGPPDAIGTSYGDHLSNDPGWGGALPASGGVVAAGDSWTVDFDVVASVVTWFDAAGNITTPGLYLLVWGVGDWVAFTTTGLHARLFSSVFHVTENFDIDVLTGTGNVNFIDMQSLLTPGVDLPAPVFGNYVVDADATGAINVTLDVYRLIY